MVRVWAIDNQEKEEEYKCKEEEKRKENTWKINVKIPYIATFPFNRVKSYQQLAAGTSCCSWAFIQAEGVQRILDPPYRVQHASRRYQ